MKAPAISSLESWKRRPWLLFLTFSTANALLAYSSFFGWIKILIALTGLVLPLGFLVFLNSGESPSKPLFLQESFGLPKAWPWILAAAAAASLRFFSLLSFSGFPLYDEALNGFYAEGLARHWTWNFFFSSAQLPPLYLWLLALAFKVWGGSLFLLWMEPALFSFLGALLSYPAARTCCSRSFSFLLLLFVSLSFWPAYVGRFAHQGVLLLAWEWVTLALLGLWIYKPSVGRWKVGPTLLGACAGIGFYTYVEWTLVAAVVFMTVTTAIFSGEKSRRWPGFFWFSFSFLLSVFPLLVDAFREGYGDYVLNLFVLNPYNPGTFLDFSKVLDNFLVLFWGASQKGFSYGPAWGGFLNPISAGFFFLGIGELWRSRSEKLVRWVGFTFLVLFIPILFSSLFNAFHLISLIPFVLFTAVLGCQRLLVASRSRGRFLLGLFLVVSFTLDGRNLEKSSWALQHLEPAQKPPEYVKAYQLLKDLAERRGPGLFFPFFTVDEVKPPFLQVATSSFNGVFNSKLPLEKCSWAAVLTNVHYQPFLNRRFPGGRAFWLSKDQPPPDGGRMLWITTLTPASLPVFLRWKEAAESFRPYQEENVMNRGGKNVQKSIAPVLKALVQAYPSFRNDPFLESSFWEKLSDLSFQALLLNTYQKTTGLILPETPNSGFSKKEIDPLALGQPIRDLKNAIRKGYPAAHLYFHLGVLLEMAGKPLEARQAFQKASQSPLDFTKSKEYIKIMTMKNN